MTGPPDFDTSTWPPLQQKLVEKYPKIYAGNVLVGANYLLYFAEKRSDKGRNVYKNASPDKILTASTAANGCNKHSTVQQSTTGKSTTNTTAKTGTHTNLTTPEKVPVEDTQGVKNNHLAASAGSRIASAKISKQLAATSGNTNSAASYKNLKPQSNVDPGVSKSTTGTVKNIKLCVAKQAAPHRSTPRLIVPEECQLELVTWQHKALMHAGYTKVLAALRKHFHWPEMKKDTRYIVTNCSTCNILNAKRAAAHKHFRAKICSAPRTSWAMDYYGVAPSEDDHNNILGAIDMATSELRLFAVKRRTGAITTDAVLQGIVLRDGVPKALHSDHAKEFVGACLKTLSKVFGIRRTTTLAHHPTGNAKMERVWQYVGKCLKTMTDEQHKHWPAYIRLMEHTWNTIISTLLGVSPFEAAHGLPAASAQSRMAEDGEYTSPSTMDHAGIAAMQTTAKAFAQIIKQLQTQDATQRAEAANAKGYNHQLGVGDKVSFFIPPTAQEAAKRGRKVKHIAHFKGPATIIKQYSPTTYRIKYNDSTYDRCLSELRPYRADSKPTAITQQTLTHDLKVGKYVAICDTDDPANENYNRYHLGKVTNIADGQASIANYATFGKNIITARWKPLYQKDNGTYTLAKPRKAAASKRVIDIVDVDDQSYVRHFDVKLNTHGKHPKIALQTRKQLRALGLEHHVLGKTYP